MKLEINHRKRSENKVTWKLNNMLLKNQWVHDEMERFFFNYLKINDNENTKSFS